jgi:hypothetical protein
MNVIAKKLLKVIIPVTVGTVILVGCFWIGDRLEPNTGALICEDPSSPNTTYLKAMVIIAVTGILYQLTIAKVLRDNIKTTKVLAFAIEITGFAACFATLLGCDKLLLGQPVKLGDLLFTGLILGGAYSVSILLFNRLIKW